MTVLGYLLVDQLIGRILVSYNWHKKSKKSTDSAGAFCFLKL